MITAEMITVIIPAYNAEKYLEESITSVNKQLEGTCNIIVVDDGSTDNTKAVAEKLGCKVLAGEHKGASHARNQALHAFDTPFLLFLDADDVLTEDALKSLLGEFNADEELQAVFGMAEDFISPELSTEQAAGLKPRMEPYGGILPGCALLKKTVYDQIGDFNEKLSPGEVVDWILRLRTSGLKTKQISKVTLKRRLHMNNSGRVQKQDEAKNYAAILRARMRERKK